MTSRPRRSSSFPLRSFRKRPDHEIHLLRHLYIGYGITAFVFAWDAVSYFSGVHSFFGLTLIWFLIIPVLLMIPFAPAAMICALIYYLAAIRGWGYLLAIIYCFPSIGLVILSMISGGIGAISGWLSEKFHRF